MLGFPVEQVDKVEMTEEVKVMVMTVEMTEEVKVVVETVEMMEEVVN